MSGDIIQSLVSAAEIRKTEQGNYAAFLAIERNHLAQASLLVNLGADIHAEDMEDTSALVGRSGRALKRSGRHLGKQCQSRDSGDVRHCTSQFFRTQSRCSRFLSNPARTLTPATRMATRLHIAVRENDRAN